MGQNKEYRNRLKHILSTYCQHMWKGISTEKREFFCVFFFLTNGVATTGHQYARNQTPTK